MLSLFKQFNFKIPSDSNKLESVIELDDLDKSEMLDCESLIILYE